MVPVPTDAAAADSLEPDRWLASAPADASRTRAGVEVLRGGALRRITNAPLHSNSYLLASPSDDGSCVVIDPGLDQARVDAALADSGWTPVAVLCTHGHFDHVGCAAWLQQRHGIPVYLNALDLKPAQLANFMMKVFKIDLRIELPEFSLLNGDAPVVAAAGRHFTFHAVPGHTPGSTAIACDDLLFSGDSLYARRTALSKLPGENHDRLRQSLAGLFAWIDGDVLVLPGHGATGTIDDIRANNQELRAFMAAASPGPSEIRHP